VTLKEHNVGEEPSAQTCLLLADRCLSHDIVGLNKVSASRQVQSNLLPPGPMTSTSH